MKYMIVEYGDFPAIKLLTFCLEEIGYEVTLLDLHEAKSWNKKK